MDKTRLEMTVGFFVLLALAIFFVIVFFISGVYFLREGYQVQAQFNYSAGIDKGSPVRLLGVRVGEVNGVSVEYDSETQQAYAIVDMWLRSGTIIHEDAEVYIAGTMGLNERHIEFFSSGTPNRRILQDGGSVKGIDPIPMEKIMERGIEITQQIEAIADKMSAILGDEEIQKAFQTMILDMSQLLEYMNRIVIEKGDDINGAVDDMSGTLENLNSIVDTIDKGEGSLGKLVNNNDLYEQLQNFIKELDLETKELIREIKLHPWRLLKKDKDAEDESEVEESKKGFFRR